MKYPELISMYKICYTWFSVIALGESGELDPFSWNAAVTRKCGSFPSFCDVCDDSFETSSKLRLFDFDGIKDIVSALLSSAFSSVFAMFEEGCILPDDFIDAQSHEKSICIDGIQNLNKRNSLLFSTKVDECHERSVCFLGLSIERISKKDVTK